MVLFYSQCKPIFKPACVAASHCQHVCVKAQLISSSVKAQLLCEEAIQPLAVLDRCLTGAL